MKFFHLSDLHLGLKLRGYDLDEDQKYVLEQIIERTKQEEPDAVVIAGDVYDRANPDVEAVRLFDWFIRELREALPDRGRILIISGNHDSGERLSVLNSLLSQERVDIAGAAPHTEDDHLMRVDMDDTYGTVHFYLFPFVKPTMASELVGRDENDHYLSYEETIRRLLAREDIDEQERNVVVSHQYYVPGSDPLDRMDSELPVIGNVDAVSMDVLSQFDYAALGHLHKPNASGKELMRYCGTPMPCSVSEAGQQKGIVVVEMGEKGNISTSVLPLTPLHGIQKIQDTSEHILELPATECDAYTDIVLTDDKDTSPTEVLEKLQHKFPRLLGIDHANRVKAAQAGRKQQTDLKEMSVLDICTEFLDTTDPELTKLLEQVIRDVQEQEQYQEGVR